MKKGARAERHDHSGGEESYVISGSLRVDRRVDKTNTQLPDVVVSAGEYLYAPPGEVHEGIAEEDTLFLVVAPGGVKST
jgi:quercetin dioxygenase-like cupin family protein